MTILGAVERLAHIDRRIEKKLQWKRSIQRNVFPFKQTCSREREVGYVALCLVDAAALEDDDDTRYIGAGVVLPDDARLPESKHVSDFFLDVGLDGLHRYPGFEAIVGNDLHCASPNGWQDWSESRAWPPMHHLSNSIFEFEFICSLNNRMPVQRHRELSSLVRRKRPWVHQESTDDEGDSDNATLGAGV